MKKLFWWAVAMIILVVAEYAVALHMRGNQEEAITFLAMVSSANVFIVGLVAIIAIARFHFVGFIVSYMSILATAIATSLVFKPDSIAYAIALVFILIIFAFSFAKNENVPLWRVLGVLISEIGGEIACILILHISIPFAVLVAVVGISAMALFAFVAEYNS